MTTTVRILTFDPPAVELPSCDPVPAGELFIELPALRVVFGAFDLIAHDATVRGELPGAGLRLDLAEPMGRGELAAMVAELLPSLQWVHGELQAELDRRGALYAPGKLPPVLALVALRNSLGVAL